MPGQLALTPLPRHDGSHAFVFEPVEEAGQLGPQDSGVRESSEERLNGIQEYPLGTNRINGIAEPHKQPLKVVLPRFLDLTAVQLDVVESQFFLGHEHW